MCRKIQPLCSHCSMPQQELWDFCDYFQLQLRHVMNENERLDKCDEPALELPDPIKCWCFSGSKIQIPVLFGCEEYECPSWSNTEHLGGADGAKFSQASAAMARKIFEQNKEKFARENFVRRSIPQQKEPVSFMAMAQRSIESTLQSDSDSNDSGDDTIPTMIQKKPQHRPRRRMVSRVLSRRASGGKKPAAAAVSSKGSKRDSMSSPSLVVSSTPASSVTPTAMEVTNKANNSDEGHEHVKFPSLQDVRPARLTNFDPIPTTMVTKDNATVTFRLLSAPRSPKWVTSVEICNEPRPGTVELPDGVVKESGALKKCFMASRVFGAARNMISRVF